MCTLPPYNGIRNGLNLCSCKYFHGKLWIKIYLSLYNREYKNVLNPLSAKLTKWPNTLKQFVSNLPPNCLSVLGHFVGLTLKGLGFIDDLFLIWTGSEQELLDFMNDLNKKHPSIKFEFKYSQTKIEFLDVLVYKDHNKMLQTTI